MDKFAAFKKLIDDAQGLIFDFDGFLADSEKYHFLSYKTVFAKHGHHIDETEYYKYWTSLGHGAWGEIERHKLDLDPLAIRNEKRPMFSQFCKDGSIELFKEAHEVIDIFGKTNKTMVIASGSYTYDIKAILKNAGHESTFETILGYDNVSKTKPAPDIFIETLRVINLPAERCVVFEDAEKGVEAAEKCGIPAIVVRTRETQRFEFKGANVILDSHAELIDFVRRL